MPSSGPLEVANGKKSGPLEVTHHFFDLQTSPTVSLYNQGGFFGGWFGVRMFFQFCLLKFPPRWRPRRVRSSPCWADCVQRKDSCWRRKSIWSWSQRWKMRVPIGSMYGIFTYIYHKFEPNVGASTIHGSYGVHIKHTNVICIFWWIFGALQISESFQGVFESWFSEAKKTSQIFFSADFNGLKDMIFQQIIIRLFLEMITFEDRLSQVGRFHF